MKHLLLVLCLALCAPVYADVQTWQFKDVNLIADEDVFGGNPQPPTGVLTGYFLYDTHSKAIVDFNLTANGVVFSPSSPGAVTKWSAAHFVFDEGFSPASSESLALFLTQPLTAQASPILISTESAIYYDYGRSKIHLTSGSIELAHSISSVPEPAASQAMLVGIALAILVLGNQAVTPDRN